ncbi:hypothetical protein WBG78_18710 [Chryseolinea sp. T2]|uniref:hypothetical protein n=1 Tax=Chryseolinea sp. T2 TaxID=3129255 RepID=UPI003077E385
MSSQRYISSLVWLALMIASFSCETERILFNGPYHVRFTESAAFEKESYSKVIKIEVHNVGPAIDQDMAISYDIGGTARENVDYVILDERKKLVIPAGEYFGYIRIQLINNANNILRSQDVVFTLQATDQDDIGIGQGASAIGSTFTYTIYDDCILGGSYNGNRLNGGNVYSDLTVTSQDCETYTLSNWNLDVFNSSTEMDLVFIDNGDNTITIPQQEEDALDDELATIEGEGVVDPTTREILLNITLVDFEDKPTVSIVLKPE